MMPPYAPEVQEARSRGAGASRRLPARVDAVTLLTVYLVLLVGVPATLVVGALGAAGSPATLYGAACLAWWTFGRIDRRFGLAKGRQPLYFVVGAFVVAMLCGYAAGAIRVALPLEVRSADRAMLKMLSGIGVLLLAADGLRRREDIDRLLRRVAVAGGVLAGVGLLQFLFAIEVTSYIRIPGLVSQMSTNIIQQRSMFRRVSGTTSHPIEFGVTLCILFPIALHCALTAVARSRRYWTIAILIGAAIPTSISRSAMLGLGLSWGVLIVGWEPRRRLNALLVTPLALAVMRLAVPGLLGTIKSLFTGLSNDPSYLGRTKDYEYVGRFIAESPWFGRGFGTFVPELYTTLDNQYLAQIVETGYVGLTALLVLLTSGLVLGWKIKRRAADSSQRSLGVALTAAAIVPLATFITFDGLSFNVVTGFTFLILGCTGAGYRLYVDGGRTPPDAGRTPAGHGDQPRVGKGSPPFPPPATPAPGEMAPAGGAVFRAEERR